MNKLLATLLTIFSAMPSMAQLCEYDLNAPFGWCTCNDYQTPGFNLNGGDANSDKRTVTLTATGNDQSAEIANAIKKNDVVVLDGSKGDFILKHNFHISSVANKTIVGINNACLCTEFHITPELKQLLDDAGVRKASTSGGTGGVLSNGNKVSEQREFLTRQTLMDAGFDDNQVRSSGIMAMQKSSNIIIRNINFVGPGPIDVGGSDLLTLSGCTNVWVDHCSFTDGIDGNFDINQGSDLITVSWCIFKYTERAYDHMNTNLVGGNDRDGLNANKHNVTFAHCIWGNKCNQRMPMVRNGVIHLLNDYYNCPGNSVSINPRANAQFIVEGISVAEGVKLFSQTKALSCHFSKGCYLNGFDEESSLVNFGPVPQLPYSYEVQSASIVAENTNKYAGATLTSPLTFGR